MKKDKEIKSRSFLYRTTDQELMLMKEYSRVLGITKGTLIREAVRKFLEDNKDVYLGIRNGDLVSVKHKGYNVIIYQRKEYEEQLRANQEMRKQAAGDIEVNLEKGD